MNLVIIAISILTFNIPFGYWRANVKRYSLQWVLSIHIPVPFIILLRIYSNIGFALYTYPILVGTFFLGQLAGKYFFSRRKKENFSPLTSCLVMDLYRSYSKD